LTIPSLNITLFEIGFFGYKIAIATCALFELHKPFAQQSRLTASAMRAGSEPEHDFAKTIVALLICF
jgi:hypothetical protein